MDIFNLPKVSKISLDSSTISVASSASPTHEEENRGLVEEDVHRASSQRKRGNVNFWKDQDFASAREWRMHVSGDLYRFNQKRKAEGKRELSEREFKEKFSEENKGDESDRESISGSGEDDLSSSSDSSDDDDEMEEYIDPNDPEAHEKRQELKRKQREKFINNKKKRERKRLERQQQIRKDGEPY